MACYSLMFRLGFLIYYIMEFQLYPDLSIGSDLGKLNPRPWKENEILCKSTRRMKRWVGTRLCMFRPE